jgi:heptosyltransferase-2
VPEDPILVKGNNWLGDAVMSVPAIRGLKHYFPRAPIAVLTQEKLAQLYEAVEEVDEVIPYRGWVGAVRKIRKRSFQACLILPRSFSSALLTAIAGIPRRVGYAADRRSVLLDVPVPRGEEFLRTHRVYYFFNLLRAFGPTPPIPSGRLTARPESREWAQQTVRGLGVNGKLLVGFNPGAAYGTAKQWARERFVELGRRLVREMDAFVVTVGAGSEAALGQQVARGIGNHAESFSGRTNLHQLLALVERCDLFVTNDTGPMHVASALGRPTVAVFGSTDPVTTRPFDPNHVLVRRPIECSPCLKRECPLKHHQCMESIPVDEVYDACQRILRRART